MALVWAGAFAIVATTGFLFKISEDFSRLLFGLWFVAGLGLLVVVRMIMARMIRRWARNGRMERRAVIVGGGKAAEGLIRSIEAATLQRHPHLRHLRRPRRQALAADRRRLPEARQHRRADRVRPHRPHRHADRVAAAHRRKPGAVSS